MTATRRRSFTLASDVGVSAEETAAGGTLARPDARADARPTPIPAQPGERAPMALSPSETAAKKRAHRLVTGAALAYASSLSRAADKRTELLTELDAAGDALTAAEVSAILTLAGIEIR